jgi:ribosomal protein S18 acetylase RimI-like enzyme
MLHRGSEREGAARRRPGSPQLQRRPEAVAPARRPPRGRRFPEPKTRFPVQVTIRPFRPEDLDGLFVLDYRCYAPEYRFGYQQLLLTLQQPDVSALVIEGERKGDVVGGLIVRGERQAQRAAIVSLMVEPDFRRLGLAKRLVQWAVGYARKSGWEAVVVPVEHGNEGAAAFLGAQGFQDTGAGQPWFAAPEVGTLWRLALAGTEETQAEAGATQP